MTREQARTARHLSVSLEREEACLSFPYVADDVDEGRIEVRYPSSAEPFLDALGPAIGLGVAVYLAQLCLADEVELTFPSSTEMVDAISPIAEMLYDVRRWKDDLPLGDPPKISWAGTIIAQPTSAEAVPKRSALMWSGGKDSTLGAILLQQNGYEVRGVHVTANAGVEDAERRAVTTLSQRLEVPLTVVELSHPQFLEFSTSYARNWNQFPYCNTVPFGRDLLVSLVSTPVVHQLRAACISMGHDHECRNAYVEYQGKRFPRNDVESVTGALALEQYLQRFLLSSVQLLPPLAQLSEFRILREMLTTHSDLMSQTSFCFWGNNCGRCAKCLRYHLAQRVARKDVLSFEVDPLAPGTCPELEDLLSEWGKPGLLFQKQVVYCLSFLVRNHDKAIGLELRKRLDGSVLLQVDSHLEGWHDELMREGRDPQVPQDWISSLEA